MSSVSVYWTHRRRKFNARLEEDGLTDSVRFRPNAAHSRRRFMPVVSGFGALAELPSEHVTDKSNTGSSRRRG